MDLKIAGAVVTTMGAAILAGCEKDSNPASREPLARALTAANEKLEQQHLSLSSENLTRLPEAARTLLELQRLCQTDPLLLAIREHARLTNSAYFVGDEFHCKLQPEDIDDGALSYIAINADGLTVSWNSAFRASGVLRDGRNGLGSERSFFELEVQPEHILAANVDQARLMGDAERLAKKLLSK
ncbi:MAG: hypothetical protein J0M12_05895 [Deltaproteobacteria bacterium]|nr:hypothetical protein [Deltaproteobacteria bacterium]